MGGEIILGTLGVCVMILAITGTTFVVILAIRALKR